MASEFVLAPTQMFGLDPGPCYPDRGCDLHASTVGVSSADESLALLLPGNPTWEPRAETYRPAGLAAVALRSLEL